MNHNKSTNLFFSDKFLISWGFIFIFIASVIIARLPIASSYELSIYHSYPFYFWILVIGSLLIGTMVLVKNAFYNSESSNIPTISYLLVIFVNMIIILLPVFRGYYLSSGGDEITHLGWILDIINNGHIGQSNIYPISHIIACQLASILSIEPRIIINFIPAIFYLIYMLGIFVLSKNISKKYQQIYLILAFSSVLLFTYFQYLFFPTQNIVYILPIFLYLIFRFKDNPDISNSILVIISLIILPFIHPLGSIIIIGILIIISLFSIFMRKSVNIEKSSKTYPSSLKLIWIPIFILCIVFFAWFSNFTMFDVSIQNAVNWFLTGEGKTPIMYITEEATSVDYSILDVIIRVIKNYGQDIIFGLLSVLSILFLIYKYLHLKKTPSTLELVFSFLFIFLGIFAVSTIFTSFIGTGSSLRLFCWPLVICVVLNGMIYYDWITHINGMLKILSVTVISMFICISIIIGIFNVYLSPFIDAGDNQVTKSEWFSMKHFFVIKSNFSTLCFNQLPSRAPDALFGTDSMKPDNIGRFFYIPDRLGYVENQTLSNSIKDSMYLIINEREKVNKLTLRPDVGSYTWEDLHRVYSDTGINLIFSSRETNICLITALEDRYD